MLFSLAESEYKVKKISNWRVGRCALRASIRSAISGLHPTALERQAPELNYRPSNIVVKESKKGDSLQGTYLITEKNFEKILELRNKTYVNKLRNKTKLPAL